MSEIEGALAVARRSGGRIVGARSQSKVGLASSPAPFKCGSCLYFGRKTPRLCDNPNPELLDRKVEAKWCCNLYDHPGMKVIV